MRGVLPALALAFAFMMLPGQADAQAGDDPAEEAAESAEELDVAGMEAEVLIDEETGERYVEARPDEELRRGSFVAPPWVIYGAGALVSLATIGLLLRRLRA